jgi:hypothetical protein
MTLPEPYSAPLAGFSLGRRRATRRSSACSRRFGSETSRSSRLNVKSIMSSASSFERLPTCAPSFAPLANTLCQFPKGRVETLIIEQPLQSQSKIAACLSVGCFAPPSDGSGKSGPVTRSRRSLNIVAAALYRIASGTLLKRIRKFVRQKFRRRIVRLVSKRHVSLHLSQYC